MLQKIGIEAKKVSKILSSISEEQKNEALQAMSNNILKDMNYILDENQKDLIKGKEEAITDALTDRLKLNSERVKSMADGLIKLIKQEDPVGKIEKEWTGENGLHFKKIRFPFGVIGVIYEARPNVTSDVGGLCLKSGNASILRGSSYSLNSNRAVLESLREGLSSAGLPPTSIQLIEETSREMGLELMKLTKYVDLLIPRGGKGLIQSMVENATVPYILDGDGNVHLYIHEDADTEKVNRIVINSKVQRPGVCNALETLVINSKYLKENGNSVIDELLENNVEIFIDKSLSKEYPDCKVASREDYLTEFHDYKIAIKVVDSLDQAIIHINTYSSGHTESILTKDHRVGERFANSIDSSVVFINASTRFTDGEVFGLGAEIGISTQKLHVRGPMGLEALTSERYIVKGDGQIRE